MDIFFCHKLFGIFTFQTSFSSSLSTDSFIYDLMQPNSLHDLCQTLFNPKIQFCQFKRTLIPLVQTFSSKRKTFSKHEAVHITQQFDLDFIADSLIRHENTRTLTKKEWINSKIGCNSIHPCQVKRTLIPQLEIPPCKHQGDLCSSVILA